LTALSQAPQPQQQPQQQQPQRSQQPQQQQRRRNRKAKREEEANNEGEGEDEDILSLLSQTQKKQIQQTQQKQQQKVVQKQRTQTLFQKKKKIEEDLEKDRKLQAHFLREGKKIVDVGICYRYDAIGDLVLSTYDLAFRSNELQHHISRLVPEDFTMSVYVFFDLDDPESVMDLPDLHRALINQPQVTRAEDREQTVPDELFSRRMTVQVLVDKKNALQNRNDRNPLDEPEVKKLREDAKEVTVARVSVLCWVYHMCRALETMMKGKTRTDYNRRRPGKRYGFPWMPLKKIRDSSLPWCNPTKRQDLSGLYTDREEQFQERGPRTKMKRDWETSSDLFGWDPEDDIYRYWY